MKHTVYLLIAAALFTQSSNSQVAIEDPSATKVVAEDAKVEKLAGDMKFTEGPVWVPTKKALIFSDIPASKLMQWKDGKLTEYRASEEANGNALDVNGALLSCQHRARNLVREEQDGTLTVLAEAHDGKKLNSPNDLAVKSDGTIYFTDPPYGLKGRPKEQEGNFVFRLDPKTKAVTVVSKEFDMPNGIAFSPDEKRLYIADSGKLAKVGAFDINADGSLSAAVFWMEGGSDGIRVDVLGNIYTTHGDGVRIYNNQGKKIATLKVPEQPANIAFGGDDYKTLFITARTSLYRAQLLVAGHRLGAK